MLLVHFTHAHMYVHMCILERAHANTCTLSGIFTMQQNLFLWSYKLYNFSSLTFYAQFTFCRLALFFSIKDELPEYAKVCCISHLVLFKINTTLDILNRIMTPHCI